MPRTKWDTLEKEWDKVRPLTMTETGVSAKLRLIQVALKDYARAFVENTSGPDSAKSDDDRFQKGFAGHVKVAKSLLTVDPRVAKNSKTKQFIEKLIEDLEAEKAFWDGDPCQKRYAKSVRFAEPEEDASAAFARLAKKLKDAPNYLEASKRFVIGAETCFAGDRQMQNKLKAFGGAFKATVAKVNESLSKDPPDVATAKSQIARLKTAPAQLVTEFPDGGALLKKAVEDYLIAPMEQVVTDQEENR